MSIKENRKVKEQERKLVSTNVYLRDHLQYKIQFSQRDAIYVHIMTLTINTGTAGTGE